MVNSFLSYFMAAVFTCVAWSAFESARRAYKLKRLPYAIVDALISLLAAIAVAGIITLELIIINV